MQMMKAPSHACGSEATIEGCTYKIPKSGVIQLVSEGHEQTLKLHGFTPHYEEPVDVVAKIDDMDDKDELVTFIEERGGEADNTMSLKKLRRLAHQSIED